MSRWQLEPASARPNVADWLRQLGLERYEATFLENDVSAAILPGLTAEDLKELGILSVGHRRQLLQAIAELRADAKTASDRISQLSQANASLSGSTAERRQLSVMFCDVIDFTALSSRIDPEDLSAVFVATSPSWPRPSPALEVSSPGM